MNLGVPEVVPRTKSDIKILHPIAALLFLQLAANIGPEFLDHESDRVVAHLRTPNAGGIGQGAIAGIVLGNPHTVKTIERTAGVVAVSRDGGGDGAAKHLGKVELPLARIAASDDDAAGGVAGARDKAPLGLREKARILMENGGTDRSHKKVFNGAIRSVGAVALAVRFPALTEAGFAVLGLADTRQSGVPDDLDRIEGALGDNFEFLPGGEGNDLPVRIDG